MKKYRIFLIACMAVCLLPFAGMAVHPTTVSTENKTMAAFPAVRQEDGSLNLSFFDEFEDWFEEHFAFRNELVYADAKIQTAAFRVSNVDSVIYGREGWLYYTSTLEDYLGEDVMSDREIYNLAHNLLLVSDYVKARGCDFLLTIPPNKNTLYGENMPWYDSGKVDERHNIDLLAPELKTLGVPYANLTELFRAEDEVLYLKRDSHWNNRGALLAYNCLMDTLGYPHDDYAEISVSRAKDEDGDLNRMLYTLYGEKELNYYYEIPGEYTYANDVTSVEDAWIETAGGSGNGTLLMFRDSFGNTLLPLLANQFAEAYFTKETPYGLEQLMNTYDPDTVIVEKVERNIVQYIESPPIITAPEIARPDTQEEVQSNTTVYAESFAYDSAYYRICGEADDAYLGDETDILICVNGSCYQAYHTGTAGYELYLPKEQLSSGSFEVEVLAVENGSGRILLKKNLQF